MTAAGEVDAADAPPPLRRNRDFLLLWTGSGFSQLGARMSAIAFPLVLLWHNGSPLGAGLVGFANLLPTLLLQLPAGILVDRWDRRRIMITCDTVAVVGMASVAVALVFGKVWLPHLMVVSFLEGTVLIFYLLAERAAVRNVVHTSHIPAAISQNEARGRAASMLGQPAGSGLFVVLWWLPFAATALGHLIALLNLSLVRTRFQQEREVKPLDLKRDVVEGVRWLWSEKFMRNATVIVSVTNFLAQIVTLAPIVVIKHLGGSAALTGLIGTVGGIGGVLGALAAAVLLRKMALGGVMLLDLTTRCVLIPVMALTSFIPLLFVPFAVMSFTGAVLNVGAGAYMSRVVPDELQGRAMSAVMLTSWGANSLGSLVAGVMLTAFSTTTTLLSVAAALVVVLLGAALNPTVRKADVR